jgi:hypothetical protein
MHAQICYTFAVKMQAILFFWIKKEKKQTPHDEHLLFMNYYIGESGTIEW